MKCYDVIILGAGISGLLLARQLSENYSVLIVEKGIDIPNHKFWVTGKASIKQSNVLENCVENRFSLLDFIAHDGYKITAHGEYILLNTELVISKLLSDIADRKIKFEFSQRFYNYCYSKNSITIQYGAKKRPVDFLLIAWGQIPL